MVMNVIPTTTTIVNITQKRNNEQKHKKKKNEKITTKPVPYDKATTSRTDSRNRNELRLLVKRNGRKPILLMLELNVHD
jgi:hypothetical protein